MKQKLKIPMQVNEANPINRIDTKLKKIDYSVIKNAPKINFIPKAK